MEPKHIVAPGSPSPKSEEIVAYKLNPATLKRLERTVRKLPRLQREIFLAARLDGMDYFEIAERTGLSVWEVERHIAKALVTLVRGMDKPSGCRWRR